MRVQFTFDGSLPKSKVEKEVAYAKENMKLYTERRCVRADEGGRGFSIECGNIESTFFAGVIFCKVISTYHEKVKAERLD